MAMRANNPISSMTSISNPKPQVYKLKPLFTCPHHGVHCPAMRWTPPGKPWRVHWPYLNHLDYDERPQFDTWAEAYAFARTLRPPLPMNTMFPLSMPMPLGDAGRQ